MVTSWFASSASSLGVPPEPASRRSAAISELLVRGLTTGLVPRGLGLGLVDQELDLLDLGHDRGDLGLEA